MARFAGALRSRGVGFGFGDRALILMRNRPECLEAVLAINALGALAVPVNFRMTPPEVAFLAQNSGSTLVITDRTLVEAVAAHRDSLKSTITVEESCETSLGGSEPATVDVPDDAPAAIGRPDNRWGEVHVAMVALDD